MQEVSGGLQLFEYCRTYIADTELKKGERKLLRLTLRDRSTRNVSKYLVQSAEIKYYKYITDQKIAKIKKMSFCTKNLMRKNFNKFGLYSKY